MKILAPGLFTTVQDLGRSGYRKDGVTKAGVMDPVAFRIANWLVGNHENAAGLEITLAGPTIEFPNPALVAICGAGLSPDIANVPLPNWRRIFVDREAILSFGNIQWGCRAYIAISGGITVPRVMQSRSTYARAGIGGYGGRPLRAGDTLPLGALSNGMQKDIDRARSRLGPMPFVIGKPRIERDRLVNLYEADSIKVMRGIHFELFHENDQQSLVDAGFMVTPRSDRMGYRLGGSPLTSTKSRELISTGVLAGSIQVPPDGHPIVLMADSQTTGGYPILANVATCDLPLVAQLKPGDQIRFNKCTINDAQVAARVQEHRLLAIKEEVEAIAAG